MRNASPPFVPAGKRSRVGVQVNRAFAELGVAFLPDAHFDAASVGWDTDDPDAGQEDDDADEDEDQVFGGKEGELVIVHKAVEDGAEVVKAECH